MKSRHTVQVIGTKSHEAIWGEIARAAKVETPPAGSITAADFAKTYGFTHRQAETALRKSVDSGKLNMGKFRSPTPTGLREMNFYWEATA